MAKTKKNTEELIEEIEIVAPKKRRKKAETDINKSSKKETQTIEIDDENEEEIIKPIISEDDVIFDENARKQRPKVEEFDREALLIEKIKEHAGEKVLVSELKKMVAKAKDDYGMVEGSLFNPGGINFLAKMLLKSFNKKIKEQPNNMYDFKKMKEEAMKKHAAEIQERIEQRKEKRDR